MYDYFSHPVDVTCAPLKEKGKRETFSFSRRPSLSLLVCAELVGESVLSIQSSEKVTSISLPPTPPYHTLEFQLEVLCVIPSGADRPANERLTNGEVRHRPRSYSHPDTPMTAIDQRVRSLEPTRWKILHSGVVV